MQEYTLSDVAKHKSKEKGIWIVLDNKVYDVTKFLDEHPGGDLILLANAGSDCTEEFKNVGHSKDVIEMREEYLIGILSKTE